MGRIRHDNLEIVTLLQSFFSGLPRSNVVAVRRELRRQQMMNGLVADGYWRARFALLARVRAEVEAEYLMSWQEAGFWRRIWLRVEIRRETLRRIQSKAPVNGLY